MAETVVKDVRQSTDFVVERMGEVAILHARSPRAVGFLNLQMRGAMRYGNAVVLESYQVSSALQVLQLEQYTVAPAETVTTP